MRKLFSISIGLFALAVALALSSYAGLIEPKFADYLNTLSDDDFVSAIIYLQDRPNTKALDLGLRLGKARMKVRHEKVLTALKEAAERSQPALLNYLNAGKQAGTIKGYTPYWITNMIVVFATKAELERIAQRVDVETIEPNFRAVLIESAGNAYMGSTTGGIRVTKSLKAINADRVWKQLGITGTGRLVANLDTGVDGVHPALAARWRGNFHPWQECWRDALGSETTSPVDYNGHGTHTMGTICGAGHLTGDTVGVAFDALWIADNAIDQSVGPEFDNDVLDAFQWFADPDGNPNTTDDVPDVVQNSWGIDARFGYDYQDCDYRWQEAIENCEAAGVVVIFSAGNEGPDPQTHRSPANICNTPTTNFSVGAVDCENYVWPYPIADFSSLGPSDCDGFTIKPEVVGPGVDVFSSFPGGGYARKSGTSMAGPHVAGVVALMRQANPDADVQTIKEVLMSTAQDLGTVSEDNIYGWGIIDAYQAVLGIRISGGAHKAFTPTDMVDPPKWAVNGGITSQSMQFDNVGTDSLHVKLSGPAWVTIAPVMFSIAEAGPTQNVNVTLNGAGFTDTILVDSIKIESNDDTVGRIYSDVEWVRIHFVITNTFDYATWDTVQLGDLKVAVSNVGNLGHQMDGWMFNYKNHDYVFDCTPVFATPDFYGYGPACFTYLYGRKDFIPGIPSTVVKNTQLKYTVVYDLFGLHPSRLPFPYHWYWPWLTHESIFLITQYSGYTFGIGICSFQTGPPFADLSYWFPVWWPWVAGQPPEPPAGLPPAGYFGIAADFDVPGEVSSQNTGGYEDSLNLIWQKCDSSAFRHYYGGFLFLGSRLVKEGSPDTAVTSYTTPYGAHVLNNAEQLYPFLGYNADSLLKYMSTSGWSVASDSAQDMNIVMSFAGPDPTQLAYPDMYELEYEYAILVTNNRISDLRNQARLVRKAKAGDADVDGKVSVSDVVYLINHLFKGGPEPWLAFSDASGDGKISVSDVVYLINYLFKGGPAPILIWKAQEPF